MNPTKPGLVVNNEAAGETRRETLSITDNRTGRQFELPITNETIKALDLRPMKVQDGDFGISRLFDRRAGGKKHICRDGLPDSVRRVAHEIAAGELVLQHHASHVYSREHQEIH